MAAGEGMRDGLASESYHVIESISVSTLPWFSNVRSPRLVDKRKPFDDFA